MKFKLKKVHMMCIGVAMFGMTTIDTLFFKSFTIEDIIKLIVISNFILLLGLYNK